jgi:hypothetical protein
MNQPRDPKQAVAKPSNPKKPRLKQVKAPIATTLEPSSLSIEAVQNALFSDKAPRPPWDLTPPDTWKCWQKPKLNLSIDDEIESLIKNQKNGESPFLISRRDDVLEDKFQTSNGIVTRPRQHCPYFMVRQRIIMAVMNADREVENANRIRLDATKFKNTQKEAQRLELSLKSFAHDIKGLSFNLLGREKPNSRTNHEDLNNTFKEMNEANDSIQAAIQALATLSNIINLEVERVPTVQLGTFLFEKIFAEFMLEVWLSLTNKKPTPRGKGVIQFVRAAYESAGYAKNPELEFQIRKACDAIKVRPEWDRFDRYKNFRDPPSTIIITQSERDAEKAAKFEIFKANVKLAIENMNNDNHQKTRESWWYIFDQYSKGIKERCDFIESLAPPDIINRLKPSLK